MTWQKEIKEIKKRQKFALAQGGKEAVQLQHKKGRFTARERIEKLVDDGSFREFGQISGGYETDKPYAFIPANYVVGLGKINSRLTAIGAEDFTLKGGSPNSAGQRKSVYSEHLAYNYKIPLVRLLEGGGGSVNKPNQNHTKNMGNPVYNEHRFTVMAKLLNEVPVVSAALGPVAGFPAGRLVSSHFSVMVKKKSQVMIGGPALVKRALGIEVSKEELGGFKVTAKSGVVDNFVESEQEAFEIIRKFLSYLPTNRKELPKRVKSSEPSNNFKKILGEIIPRDRHYTYDIFQILKAILDPESIFEIAPLYGQGLVIGLAKLDGFTIGFTANNCQFNAGAMTAQCAVKMKKIIKLCNTFNLPIVNFVDEPGFMIGPEAESLGTIKHGMEAVCAAATATAPWASIRMRKSYGVAAAAHYGPNAYILDWPSVESGALPVEGGVAVAFQKKIAASLEPDKTRREIENELLKAKSPFEASENFASHDIIDPRETRSKICEWLEWQNHTFNC